MLTPHSAVGPYATIYQIWSSGAVPGAGSDIPLWILGFLGGAIVVGLWTYGYKIMTNLGNRITLISPSRGFSMELGSAITIIMATRFGTSLTPPTLSSQYQGFANSVWFRPPNLNNTVYHRRHRRRWSVQR